MVRASVSVDGDRALLEARRVLKSGGVLAAQEPAKDADLCGGPFSEAAQRFNRLVVDDWRLARGDPFLGRRLKALAYDAGFVDVATGAVFEWADAKSNEALTTFGRARLHEATFRDRVVGLEIVDAPILDWLAESFDARMAERAAFYAGAEVQILARKPRYPRMSADQGNFDV